MKVTFTFEYADLLEQIEKMLAMNGVQALTDDEGNKQIHFNHKKKEVVIHCEAAPIPDSCPFCGSGVDQEAPTQKDDPRPKDEPSEQATQENEGESEENNVSTANTGDQEENRPMSLAALRAQSGALARKQGPIKHNVQRGAEAHAALVEPSLLDGESDEPPFPGEGGA